MLARSAIAALLTCTTAAGCGTTIVRRPLSTAVTPGMNVPIVAYETIDLAVHPCPGRVGRPGASELTISCNGAIQPFQLPVYAVQSIDVEERDWTTGAGIAFATGLMLLFWLSAECVGSLCTRE